MKNILFIEHSLDPTLGGVERVSYILSNAFNKHGYQSFFLFCHKDSDLIPEKFKSKFSLQDNTELLYNQFSHFIKERQIDIIICQNVDFPKFQTVYKKLKENHDIKLLTCFHGNPDIWVNKNRWGCTTTKIYFKELIRSIFYLFNNPFKKRLAGMYDISDRYILLSNSFIPVFKQLYHKEDNEHKLVAIPNPCSFQERVSTFSKENIVLVVARMAEQQKRISNVIKVWNQIEHEFKDWKLVLVGDGPDLNLYKKMSSKLGLRNIEIIGHSNNVAEYYKKSKVFLMTSIWEGFGMTIIEAQHYGCVPIAFNTYAALQDIITNKKNGFIIEKHNIKAFSEKVSLLLSNEDLLKTMALEAIQNIEEKFEINRISEYWINLFKSL